MKITKKDVKAGFKLLKLDGELVVPYEGAQEVSKKLTDKYYKKPTKTQTEVINRF